MLKSFFTKHLLLRWGFASQALFLLFINALAIFELQNISEMAAFALMENLILGKYLFLSASECSSAEKSRECCCGTCHCSTGQTFRSTDSSCLSFYFFSNVSNRNCIIDYIAGIVHMGNCTLYLFSVIIRKSGVELFVSIRYAKIMAELWTVKLLKLLHQLLQITSCMKSVFQQIMWLQYKIRHVL